MLESISYCLIHLLFIVFTLYHLDILFLDYNVSVVSQKYVQKNENCKSCSVTKKIYFLRTYREPMLDDCCVKSFSMFWLLIAGSFVLGEIM